MRLALAGEGAADRLDGGPGRDALHGESGRDLLLAIDGRRDRVACGAGHDRARADARDRVQACERVRRGVYTSPR